MGRKGKNAIPDDWEDYSNMGSRIAGTRFVSFKVPLQQRLCNKLPVDMWWTPDMLVGSCKKQGLDVKAVVDLTATDRYYDPRVLEELGVRHIKILCPGAYGEISEPPPDVVDRFIDTIDQFIENNPNPDALIGVHCTHGLNRTGYVICRYLMLKQGMTALQAVHAFNEARGHPMEKYVDKLACYDTSRRPTSSKSHKRKSGRRKSSPKSKKRRRKRAPSSSSAESSSSDSDSSDSGDQASTASNPMLAMFKAMLASQMANQGPSLAAASPMNAMAQMMLSLQQQAVQQATPPVPTTTAWQSPDISQATALPAPASVATDVAPPLPDVTVPPPNLAIPPPIVPSGATSATQADGSATLTTSHEDDARASATDSETEDLSAFGWNPPDAGTSQQQGEEDEEEQELVDPEQLMNEFEETLDPNEPSERAYIRQFGNGLSTSAKRRRRRVRLRRKHKTLRKGNFFQIQEMREREEEEQAEQMKKKAEEYLRKFDSSQGNTPQPNSPAQQPAAQTAELSDVSEAAD